MLFFFVNKGKIDNAFKDVKQPLTQPIRSYEDYYSRLGSGVLEEIYNLTGCCKPCQYRCCDAPINADIGMTCECKMLGSSFLGTTMHLLSR